MAETFQTISHLRALDFNCQTLEIIRVFTLRERQINTEGGKGRDEEGGRRERKLEHSAMVK